MIRNSLIFAVKVVVQGHYHFTGITMGNDNYVVRLPVQPVNKFAT